MPVIWVGELLPSLGKLMADGLMKERIFILIILNFLARSKTRKPPKSRKSRKFFPEISKSEFPILAVGQNRKLGNKKTRNDFSGIFEISDFSEFLICHIFIFLLNFFFFRKCFFKFFILHL